MASSRPDLPHGYLGPHPKFEELELATVTHNGSEFRCHTENLEIKFKHNPAKKPVKMTAVLMDPTKPEGKKEIPNLVFTQTLNELIILRVIFPSPGFFQLQIHALPVSDTSNSLPNVYNYLIQNTQPPATARFPKQYAQWKDGCYLLQPFSLKDVDEALIKVKIPKAKEVALNVNNEWFSFEKREESDFWAANATGLKALKAKGATKAVVCAHYAGEEETKYTSLLDFEL